MKKTKLTTRALTEGAVMVALAQVLGYIKLFQLPNGGSLTLCMLPIFIYCSRRGFKAGMMAAFALGLLQLLLDGAYAWGWQSMIGDYLLAYSVLGTAGLFSGRKNGFFIGIAAGSAARFVVAYLVGVIVWGEYMPDEFFGMSMTSPWFYSALYNGSHIAMCMALCLIVGGLIWKPLGAFIRGEDLKQ